MKRKLRKYQQPCVFENLNRVVCVLCVYKPDDLLTEVLVVCGILRKVTVNSLIFHRITNKHVFNKGKCVV